MGDIRLDADPAQEREIDVTLLVVEDEAELRMYLYDLFHMDEISQKLERRIHVDLAGSASEARKLIDGHYDVILLDLGIPDEEAGLPSVKTGLALMTEIKERSPKSEIIAVTGRLSETDAVRAIEGGAFYFLSKPVQTELMIALIQRIVRAKGNERLAQIDGLTRLYNKAFFNTALENEMKKFQSAQRIEPGEREYQERRKLRPLSLIIAEVDRFKRINDTYGHLRGDRILQEVAALLAETSRNSDIVARWGGDEFVILLPGAPNQQALRQGERIRKAVASNTFILGKKTEVITISVGLATFPAPFLQTPDKDTLFEAADVASYFAKRSGGNRMCGYDREGNVGMFSE